jgi:hypothetical protein
MFVTPFYLVGWYHHFEKYSLFSRQDATWRQEQFVPPKHWQLPCQTTQCNDPSGDSMYNIYMIVFPPLCLSLIRPKWPIYLPIALHTRFAPRQISIADVGSGFRSAEFNPRQRIYSSLFSTSLIGLLFVNFTTLYQMLTWLVIVHN